MNLLLGPRYANDKVVFRHLTALQKEMVRNIEDKIARSVYRFESTPCPVCLGEDFVPVSEKDRYGLYFPVGICKTCGLMQTRPRMDQSSYNEFYNQEYRKLYHAAKLPTEEWFKSQEYTGSWIFRYLEENGLLKGRKHQDTFVFEIGCGSGGILNFFRKKGFRVKGIDLGKEYLEYGKQMHGLDLETASLSNIQSDFKADIIIYSHVMEHILDPNAELQTLKRFIHPETLIYIEVPGVKNLINNYRNDLINYLQNAHVYHYTLTSLRNIFTKNGYELICGTETVKSVFRLSRHDSIVPPVNDFANVVRSLQKTEFIRKYVPFIPHEVKEKLFGKLIAGLRKSGLYNSVRSLYRATWKKIRKPV